MHIHSKVIRFPDLVSKENNLEENLFFMCVRSFYSVYLPDAESLQLPPFYLNLTIHHITHLEKFLNSRLSRILEKNNAAQNCIFWIALLPLSLV
jgi:uncharacterized membrane protein YwaF